MNIQKIADLLQRDNSNEELSKPFKVEDCTLATNGVSSYLTQEVSKLLVYADDAITKDFTKKFVGMTQRLTEEICVTFDGGKLRNLIELLLDSDGEETVTLRIHTTGNGYKLLELSTGLADVTLMQYGIVIDNIKSTSIKERVKAFNLTQPEFLDVAVGI